MALLLLMNDPQRKKKSPAQLKYERDDGIDYSETQPWDKDDAWANDMRAQSRRNGFFDDDGDDDGDDPWV